MRKAFEKILERLEEKAIEELGISVGQFVMDKGEYASYCSLSLYDVQEIIKQEVTEYNNGWIPCNSEQLPKENKFYNVTIFDGEDYRTEPAYYARIGYLGQKNIMPNWWTDCTCNAVLIEEDDNKVIAWQPLPEPYQPKGE